MSKAEKQDTEAAPKPNKMKFVVLIGIVVLVAAVIGGGAAYFLLGSSANEAKGGGHAKTEKPKGSGNPYYDQMEDEEEEEKAPPTFVDLGTFTTNLAYEDSSRIVQVKLKAKLSKAKLQDALAARLPEVTHYVNLLLQTKKPSELQTLESKLALTEKIKQQVEYVLGLRRLAPPITDDEPTKEEYPRHGVDEILISSFIIQ